jgi:hypothetical protein
LDVPEVETARVGFDASIELENEQHRSHLVGSKPGTLDQEVHAGRLEAERI